MSSNAPIIGLGESLTGTNSDTSESMYDELLGLTVDFDCLEWETLTAGIRDKRSASKIRAVLLKNNTSSTVTGGLWYKFEIDHTTVNNRIHYISGVATAVTDLPYILADPFLNSTVADGDLFWGIVSGIVPMTTSTTDSAGDWMVPTTGGEAVAETSNEWAAFAQLLEDGADSEDKLASVNCFRLPFATGI